MDECYLNLTAYLHDHPDTTTATAIQEMRANITKATRLTASAGIAPNTRLAKICSDMNKPNGQYELKSTREAITEFVDKLSVRKFTGVGRVLEQVLAAFGITTCSQLREQRGIVQALFSPIQANFLFHIALGIGGTHFDMDEDRKSVGVERTFSNMSDPALLVAKLEELTIRLAQDLDKENLMGSTISLKLKLSNFVVRTRDKTLPYHIYTQQELLEHAKPVRQCPGYLWSRYWKPSYHSKCG
jgi:DNA polymerase kappa